MNEIYQKKPGIFTPTLLGGALLGLLSSIPIVSALNMVCCLWVLLGGFVATLLYKKDGGKLNAGQGAFLGFIAGLWGTVVVTAFSTLFFTFQRDSASAQWREAMESMNIQVPPGTMEWFFMMQENIAIFILITAISWLIVNSIFATLGGLIGSAILKDKAKPQYHTDHVSTQPPEFKSDYDSYNSNDDDEEKP